MSAAQHTPGPWRWELNRKHKSVQLCGGVPRFDKIVVDFVRWGMSGAALRLREPNEPDFNIMRRVDDVPGWIEPHEGREHHVDWCADVSHPDARLIAAAPELLALAQEVAYQLADDGPGNLDVLADMARDVIAKAKGEG